MPNGKGGPWESVAKPGSHEDKAETDPGRGANPSQYGDDSKCSLPNYQTPPMGLENTMPDGKGGIQMPGNQNEQRKLHKSSSSDSSTDNKDTEPDRTRCELAGPWESVAKPGSHEDKAETDPGRGANPSQYGEIETHQTRQHFSSLQLSNFDYYGLYNLGATCYLNAVLQTLFMTKQFREAVERLVPENSSTVAVDLNDLFQNLKKGITKVGNKLLTDLGIKNKYKQQDAAEFFQKIVNLCNIPEIYHGQLRNSMKCLKNEHESGLECSSFVILPLAIESDQSYTVKDGWRKFFMLSVLNGDNQLYCDLCNEKTDTTTVCVLESCPEVLTLQLKRFYFDYNHMMYMKNDCAVEIPLQLEVKEYTYELYAIINHSGSLKYGHYYTIIKSFQDGNWYHFNDSWVTQVMPKINDKKTITCQRAYLLMYTKRSGQKGHRQEGQSDSEAEGQDGTDRLVIPKSNDVVEKSGDNISAESRTDAGRNDCFRSGGKKEEEPDKNDVTNINEGGNLDAGSGVIICKEGVEGYNRGSKESVSEGNRSIDEHNFAGNAAGKVGFTSSGEAEGKEGNLDVGSGVESGFKEDDKSNDVIKDRRKGSKLIDSTMGNIGDKGGADRHPIPDLAGDLNAEMGVLINNTDTDPIAKSRGTDKNSGDKYSSESCTDAGRNDCFRSGGKKEEEPDKNDVTNINEGGNLDAGSGVIICKEGVEGYNRGSKESVSEGNRSIDEDRAAGNAAHHLGFTSSGEAEGQARVENVPASIGGERNIMSHQVNSNDKVDVKSVAATGNVGHGKGVKRRFDTGDAEDECY